MKKLFLSYRRSDSEALTNRIHAVLEAEFGVGNVFIDKNLGAGGWLQQVMNAVNTADASIVVIGQTWLTATNPQTGAIRLMELGDVVRREVEASLLRPLTVIVLVNGAGVPNEAQLPETIRRLPDAQAFVVRDDEHFEGDVLRVAKKIKQFFNMPVREVRSRNRQPLLIGGVVALLAVIVALVFAARLANQPPSTQTPAAIAQVTDSASATLTDMPAATVDVMQIVGMTQTYETEQTLTAHPTATLPPTVDVSATVNFIATGTRSAAQTAESQRIAQATADAAATLTALPTATLIPVSPAITIFEFASTPVASNAAWTPILQQVDGVMMVLVPAGCFMMGIEDGLDNERPVHEQCITDPFWIDQTEVTQADFARLGGVKANANGFDGDQRPVERITWFEAWDFCALRDGRLPTEAEWEYAARGPNNLVYPWGDDWNPDNAVWSVNSNGETAAVASRPAGASWVGALDMSGNVWEWVSTIYLGYRYPYVATDGREQINRTDDSRVARGGSWVNSGSGLRASVRDDGFDFRSNIIGFRCARSR